MDELQALKDADEPKPVVAIIGGAVAGSEAAAACAEKGALAVVFEQGARPYGKIEDGLPRWHEKLREKEYRKIDENLLRDGVIFVPSTEVGRDLPWNQLHLEMGFSAIILANGAWRDRPLPVAGADQYVRRGLVYQNEFVYWFNHYHEEGYEGPIFEIPDDVIVIGGGLASIDVVKIVNLELYARAIRERGIDVDIVEMEIKGIPKTLEAHGLTVEELGVQGCTLYYRRRMEDMPLASADDPTPEQMTKLQAARIKIMERVMRKYFVKFEPLCLPLATIVEDGRLVGIRFQKTEMVDGRVRPVEGSEFDVQATMVISSIGSVPRPIEGIPIQGELYYFSSWETGEVHGLPGVFGLGNVLTGKGNIKDSRANAIEIVENVVAAYLGVGDEPEETPGSSAGRSEVVAGHAAAGTPMSPEAMKALADWIEERYREIGYRTYRSWLAAHARPSLETR
ncbi:MAG TPA: FAD-dependent oxidoreductase [Polyangiales bacterium]|nr:FAD-dependent oxidoreductase [Polyangiales bacterium]